ncbi:hypothetical protein ACFWNR_34095 [Streptomyces virginiae]|uniref:hypothetical protein n=1 Tax=Streptomyces virginiae TaxID=1961 RepID=UPI003650B868
MSDDHEIKGSYSSATDQELRDADRAGDAQAGYELHDRRRRSAELSARYAPSTVSSSGSNGATLLPVVLLAPIGVLGLILQGLAAGVDELTYDSPLAALFPVPGDSPIRFALSLVTLLLLIPGTLLWTSRRLRTTRLRPLGTWLISPAAVLLVPVVVYMAVVTYSADVVRLGG